MYISVLVYNQIFYLFDIFYVYYLYTASCDADALWNDYKKEFCKSEPKDLPKFLDETNFTFCRLVTCLKYLSILKVGRLPQVPIHTEDRSPASSTYPY